MKAILASGILMLAGLSAGCSQHTAISSLIGRSAVAPAMRAYRIELPHHVLRFSLPEEIAEQLRPDQIEQRFEMQDVSFVRNGFREIAGGLYTIDGPFWVGVYGSLRFHFMVQKRSPEFSGDITTVAGLEQYIRQWNKTIVGRATGCVFSRASLHGMPAVRREWDRFGDPGNIEPDYLEIFSLPLDSEIFLDVGFAVRALVPGRGREGKWRPKVEALREAIKATVVLEPKS